MAERAFDWRGLAASDEELSKHARSGHWYGPADPAAWKQAIVAAYFKEDYLSSNAKRRGIGLVDVAAAPLALAWNLLFGFPKSERTDYTIGPEEAALVVRDGRVLGTFHQTRLQTGGSFGDWLKAQAGNAPNYRLLLADCSPFVVEIPFDEEQNTLLTADDLILQGRIAARLKVDAEQLANLLGLFRGRTLLHVVDFAATIRDLIFARVLVPEVRRHLGQEIRANVGLQDKLRAECLREVEAAYRDVGIVLDDFTVVWELTEVERQAISRRRRDLAEAAAAELFEREKRAAEREVELERTRHQLAENERHRAEMQRLLHEREQGLARSENELDRQNAQIELRKVQLELESLEADHRRLQSRLDREQEIDLDERDTLAALRLKERKRQVERDDEELRAQSDHMRAMEREREQLAQERALLEQSAGMTPEQLLALRAADSPEAARALAERFRAEAVQAEDRVRRAQDVADRQVQSTQDLAKGFGEQMGRVAESAATVKSGGSSRACPGCGRPTQLTWKSCPYCGDKLPG